MIAVIDMGSIIYRAAVTNTTDDLGVSKEYLVERINDILIKTKADKYILCVDSDKNWKKLSMKSYKADRGRKFIKFLKEIKIWVISELGGTVVNGLEADDLCYIAVSEFGPQNTITCHIDSDLFISGYKSSGIIFLSTNVFHFFNNSIASRKLLQACKI